MGFLKTLIMGRENGIRTKLRGMLLGGGAEDTSPNVSYSAPSYTPAPAAPAASDVPEPPRDVTPPEGFEVVSHKAALQPGEVKEVIAGGIAIALCNVDGEYHAVTNTCAHAEGPLGEGTLEGAVLTCPYHGWSYDITDGACLTNSEVSITTYEVAIEGDAVCVRL